MSVEVQLSVARLEHLMLPGVLVIPDGVEVGNHHI